MNNKLVLWMILLIYYLEIILLISNYSEVNLILILGLKELINIGGAILQIIDSCKVRLMDSYGRTGRNL